MKVGLVSFHSFFYEGGVKTHILSLKKEFKKRKVKYKIIAPRRRWSEEYGQDFILLGSSFPITVGGTRGDLCINFTPLAIEETLEKEKFDVLHFHNFGSPLSCQILEASQALNILTAHANLDNITLLKIFPELLYPIKKTVEWKMDGIIGVAPVALKYFKGFKGPKTVIPNGVNLEEFSPKVTKIKRLFDDKINILFVGRLEERKGLIYLLRAFKILEKKFSNLRLIIVGEGELKKDYQKYIQENKLKEVFFAGEKKGKEVPPYYTSSDIFVAPSIFGESFGVVLLEAMASGVPVVAFANKGYKEFLKGKKGTLLAPPKNYKGLAKKIEILIKDESLRTKMGSQGRKEVENYSWEKICEKVLDFYELCQKNKRSKAS